MTTLNFAAVSGALNQVYEDEIASQINRACVLSQLLTIKEVKGKNVAWDARFGSSVGAAISDGTNVSTFNLDTKVPASLDVATYHDAFGVTGRAMSAAANSSGPEALVDLFAESVMESTERLAQILNTEFYAGTGGSAPETIAGLTATALVASGSYAGLAIGTYPQWASNVLANGGTPRALSLQLMRDTRRTIYVASGKKPDLIVTDPIQHEAYGQLLGQQRRYTQDVQVGGRKITLDGGYQALEMDGIPVIEDKDCPAGKMLFLNSREVFIRPMPDAVGALVGNASEVSVGGSAEEQMGPGEKRIRARIQPLAVNGDLRQFALFVYLQLQVRSPNACGILADLA